MNNKEDNKLSIEITTITLVFSFLQRESIVFSSLLFSFHLPTPSPSQIQVSVLGVTRLTG